jgi:hypothetical protein
MATNFADTTEARMVRNTQSYPRVSLGRVLSDALPALLLATACLLPFLTKPFVVDDPHFLMMARQIVHSPTHPMNFDECWNLSTSCTKAYLLTPGNALMGYVLVPTVLAGAHEWMAHLTQLLLAWVAITAMVSLTTRLGWDRTHAVIGSLLLVATAPFLPMASTAMPDILATAIALVAMERLVAWKVERKTMQGVAAAIAIGFAGFARSHLSLLIPLAAFYLLNSLDPRVIRKQIREDYGVFTPVVAGAALLLAIIGATREHNLALAPPADVSSLQYITSNFRSYLLYFVFPFPLTLCWAVSRWKARRRSLVLTTAGLAIAAYFFMRYHRPLAPALVLVTSLGVLSLVALGDFAFEALRARHRTELFLVLWVLIPLPAVYYVQMPAKYFLPCMPAVILICFQLTRALPTRATRGLYVALIITGSFYSVLILRSDAEFAQFGRDSMYRLISPRVAEGASVWFGSEFSAYWYSPLAGAALTFPGGPQPKSGDLLVVGMNEGDRTLDLFPNRSLIDSVSHKYSFGKTWGDGINLYSNWHGAAFWLWGFDHGAKDRYEMWKIN